MSKARISSEEPAVTERLQQPGTAFIDRSRWRTFPKAARVRRRREYLENQARGTRIPSRHFLLVYDRSPSGEPQLGVTVTKKIGHAPIRNRIKRQAREVFRLCRGDLPSAWRIVVVARQGAGGLTKADLRAELSSLLERLSALA